VTDPYAKTCDDVRLNLYLDGDLGDSETAWMEAHLKDCPSCRRQAATLTAFAQAFRERVHQAADTVDFVGLEKKILTQTLPRHRPPSRLLTFMASMKYILPATLAAGVLIFFVYANYMVKPAPVPSAIINSFTGSVSSVMIFETPETRQTILWYNEATDMEGEHDAL
jgi:hypothetical protein